MCPKQKRNFLRLFSHRSRPTARVCCMRTKRKRGKFRLPFDKCGLCFCFDVFKVSATRISLSSSFLFVFYCFFSSTVGSIYTICEHGVLWVGTIWLCLFTVNFLSRAAFRFIEEINEWSKKLFRSSSKDHELSRMSLFTLSMFLFTLEANSKIRNEISPSKSERKRLRNIQISS